MPVYIVHLSASEALAEVRAARDRGRRRFAETCPQYLFLSLDDLGNGFEGAKFVCSPPLRPKDHWDDLWSGLVKDDLQVVSTDHCPFDFHGQKELGRDDFRKIPNGLPGVEDRVDLMHDGGVVGGRITRERWVEIISTAPAKLFGMYPRKGSVSVGADADLVVYDPDRKRTISATTPPHGRRLLVLRGPRGPGRQRRRPVARLGHRPRRRVHRAQGPRPVRQALDRPTTLGWPDRHEPGLRMTTDAIDGIRFGHVNVTGADWRRLAAFYTEVFGCELVPPERDLRSGTTWMPATGLTDAHLTGAHLRLPGHGDTGRRSRSSRTTRSTRTPARRSSRPGWGHIAFQVPDVPAAVDAVRGRGRRAGRRASSPPRPPTGAA